MKEINSPNLKATRQVVRIGNRKKDVLIIGKSDTIKNVPPTGVRTLKTPTKRVVGGCGGCSRNKRRSNKRG